LTTNSSRKAAINYNRVARDCTGTYLASRLNRSSAEFRKEALDQLKQFEDIDEKTRKKHVSVVFPQDAATFFINGEDTGFLRKAEVYCHIRRHLNDMPGKAQLDSMVEEVQSRVSHISQFLPENAYGFLDSQNSTEGMKAMKRYYRLEDLSNEQFIKLRQVVIPLKEEQMRTALYAVSAFATAGCLKPYFEDTLKNQKCPWQMDNEPLHDEEEDLVKKATEDAAKAVEKGAVEEEKKQKEKASAAETASKKDDTAKESDKKQAEKEEEEGKPKTEMDANAGKTEAAAVADDRDDVR